jgi:seryl-tRNA synthetase
MHDRRVIRADPAGFDHALARRGLSPVAADILERDDERRRAQTLLQAHQTRRNALSKQVGEGRRSGLDTAPLESEAASLRAEMEALQQRVDTIEADISNLLDRLPNRLDPEVPDGADETANVVLKQVGAPREFGFAPRAHFPSAGRIAGSRFTILRGALARLERALGQFMIDLHTREHGYEELSVPALVNSTALYGTGQLPKFEEDLFQTTDGRWLIPTSEVPLTNMAGGQILAASQLPLRLTALTDCFRSEAGAAGSTSSGRSRWFRSPIPTRALPSRSE